MFVLIRQEGKPCTQNAPHSMSVMGSYANYEPSALAELPIALPFEGLALKVEQFLGVTVGNFHAVGVGNGSLIEPVLGLDHILKRVVH